MAWASTERNMQGSGTSHEPLDRCETIVRDYLAQGQCTLAMGVLIQHYQDAIVSYCRCHLLDQELAREVAQEIFLTACVAILIGLLGSANPAQPVLLGRAPTLSSARYRVTLETPQTIFQ